LTLSGANPTILRIPPRTTSTLNFLESVEAAHSSHSFNDRVSSILGVTRAPTRMDSQAKYCSLARGDGGAYLRMPTGVGYREKIWVSQATSLNRKQVIVDHVNFRITPQVLYSFTKPAGS
jgi:3'(2'), 5'-bisphosphate nucleotidase